MVRTQIYLTEAEHKQLHVLSRRRGASLSELIRLAIDRFLESNQADADDRLALLRQGKGIWAERTDLPNSRDLRREFDRRGDAPGSREH